MKVHESLIVALAMLIVSGCSDDRLTKPENSFEVSGVVLASYCPWWYPGQPYTPTYGHAAEVTFISDSSGLSISVLTNENSGFNALLPEGLYKVIVTTPHSRPEQLTTIAVIDDQYLKLTADLQYNQADSTIFGFFYANANDSLTYAEELALIKIVNDGSGGILDLGGYRLYVWPDHSMGANYTMHEYYVSYRGPLIGWEGADSLHSYFQIHRELFPDGMGIGQGESPCPQ